jgi:hypothetical protein
MAKLEKRCLVVVDHDRKVFSVHGPKLDDTPRLMRWSERRRAVGE